MTYSDEEMKLARFFVEREGEGVLDRLKEVDFVEEGYLDSLDLVSLAVFIEKEFGRKLDLSDSSIFEKTRTFDSLMRLTKK